MRLPLMPDLVPAFARLCFGTYPVPRRNPS